MQLRQQGAGLGSLQQRMDEQASELAALQRSLDAQATELAERAAALEEAVQGVEQVGGVMQSWEIWEFVSEGYK